MATTGLGADTSELADEEAVEALPLPEVLEAIRAREAVKQRKLSDPGCHLLQQGCRNDPLDSWVSALGLQALTRSAGRSVR
jgi:hypothetical protein